jgi:hypothetical protein
MKQETLEEAAKTYYEENIDQSNIPREHYEWEIQDLMSGFAYKWQQEISYSEAIDLFITEIKTEFKDDNWDYLEFIKERVIEQFKNK